MLKSLLLVPVLVAACADAPTYNVPTDTPSNPIAFDQLQAGTAPAMIATGGVQVISIPNDPNSVGWSGTASAGYAVEPYADIWPNTRKPEYHVRALGDGTGTFSIQTDHGIASGSVTSAEVARVEAHLVTRSPTARASLALDAGERVIEVDLFDASGHRLIDGSLAIRDDGNASSVQRAWDQLAVSATPATHTLVITADSIPEQRVTVAIE